MVIVQRPRSPVVHYMRTMCVRVTAVNVDYRLTLYAHWPCVCAQHTHNSTPTGCEPLRAEPNGLRVHLLNRSHAMSVTLKIPYTYAVRNNSGKSGCQGKTPAGQHAFAKSRRCCSSLAERKHVDTPQAVQRYETIGFHAGTIR